MNAQREKLQVDELDTLDAPIEFLTENGFSILRSWEVDHVAAPANGRFSFRVRKELEAEIIVTIADHLIADVAFRTRGKIQRPNSFWINCAEHHLADYLWEKDHYPHGNHMSVNHLHPDEIMSALKWQL